MAESPRSEPSYDGHLDLDGLDTDLATRLELLGDDEPRLGDRFRELLERHGVTPWLRTHRLATASTAAVVAIAVVVSGLWWAARPAPLPAQPPTDSITFTPG